MRRVVVHVLVGAVLTACAGGGSESSRAGTTTTGTTTGTTGDAGEPVVTSTMPAVGADGDDGDPPVRPDGFERVRGTVTAADGTVCEVCLWLAANGEQRRRGLMYVTDLGPADGMAFVYPRPRTGTFWMKNTVLPLSIAFFDRDGRFMAEFDMEPCTADPCPSYRTPTDFLVAVETVQGGLGELAMAAGSVLALTDLPCDVAP